MQLLAGKSYGLVSLWLLGIGFAAYALWRLSEAAFGVTGEPPGAGPRLNSGARSVIYAGLAYLTFEVISGTDRSQSRRQQDMTATAMQHPAGRWVVGIAGLIIVGWAHGPIGAVVAAWPAVSFVSSHELLVWLIRTAGTLEREPPAEHRCGNTACRAAARSAPAVSIDRGRHRRNDRDLSAQGWPLTDQPARQPVTLASVENSDGVPGAGTDNDAAVATYRLSVQAGNPLSERKLAQMFGRTSRRWARARIADLQQSP